MRNKAFTKRMLAVALSIIMVLGLMPMTTYAEAEGIDLPYATEFKAATQSGNNTSVMHFNITDENAASVTLMQSGSDFVFYMTLRDGWYFDKWSTYFSGAKDRPIIYDSSVEGENLKDDNGLYIFSNGSNVGPVNSDSYVGTVKVIRLNQIDNYYGSYTIVAVLKPIVKVNAGDGVTYTLTTNNPSKVYEYTYVNRDEQILLREDQIAVKYNDNAEIAYTIDDEYILTGISVNYGTNYSDNGSVIKLSSIKKPVTIDINTRLKQQMINFDANGGSGTITTQTYFYGEEQVLTGNSFTRTGYTFVGWDTKADGTGTAYADKQSVTFSPVNDGDSLTLYAQWAECKNHTWRDGECTDCGIACSHSGGTTTCTEQATCSECGMKYGDLKDHSYTYSASGAVITETCENNCGYNETATINAPAGTLVYDGTEKKATVSYSDGWQGGELSVTYEPDNIINAGNVTAKITIGGVTATVDYKIDKMEPTYTVPTGLTATYGDTLEDVELPEGWSWKDSTVSVGDAGTNTFKVIFTPANTDNYKTIEADVSVKVEPKEIGISWGTTVFTYFESKAQAPTATATGIITGDQIALSISGAKVDAGSYTATVTDITGDKAANYKLPCNVTVAFTIENASQTAPVVISVNETIYGKADGKITGVDSTMEYRKDGENTYIAISGTELTDLEAGKYYVRYMAKTNYSASVDTEVTIASGRKLTVTVPQNQNGYTLTVDKTEFEYMGGFNITFHIGEGYSKAENFAIKLNGKDMQWGDFDEIGVQSCTTDIEITVEGVVLKTYTVTYTDENGTVKTVEVEHGKKPEIPEAPVKDGYTVTWEEVPDAVTGDITIKAVYTPIPATDSTQTGDNSNMLLWITLLFISGGAMITLTVVDGKSKNNNRKGTEVEKTA